MKIVLCNGGLGNQTFQYIFSRWMELATGEPCYLDDSGFFHEHVEHNGFEINKVFPDSCPRLLSNFFSKDVWSYIVENRMQGQTVCQQMKDLGEDIVVAAETNDYSFDGNVVMLPCNEYLPSLVACKGNIYFHGYWINCNWLKSDFYQIIKKELTFTPLTESHNLKYARQITDSNSLSLHIRRGDFVKLNWDVPAEVYRTGIELAEKNVEKAHYFVFSDDLDWCRKNEVELGLNAIKDRVIWVEGNSNVSSFRDMQLMSLCKGNILVSSSSFSYLAALLNVNEHPIIINGANRQV